MSSTAETNESRLVESGQPIYTLKGMYKPRKEFSAESYRGPEGPREAAILGHMCRMDGARRAGCMMDEDGRGISHLPLYQFTRAGRLYAQKGCNERGLGRG